MAIRPYPTNKNQITDRDIETIINLIGWVMENPERAKRTSEALLSIAACVGLVGLGIWCASKL